MFLRCFRGEIKVWSDTDANGVSVMSTKPEIENPSRINTCLTNLARGHAVLCGRNFITEEDLPVVVRVALDTAPGERPEMLRILLNNNGGATLAHICKELRVGDTTAKKEMTKFIRLGVCKGNVQKQQIFGGFGGFDDNESEIPGEMNAGGTPNHMELIDKFKWLLGEDMERILVGTGIVV